MKHVRNRSAPVCYGRFSVLCLLSVACDPQATAETGEAAEAARAGKPSAQYESCGSSADCEGELRCFNNVCTDPETSLKGDVYTEIGNTARAAGRHEAAITAYRAAEAEFRAEDREPPPRLMCALGRALADRRQDPILGEEAASRLHRCLLAAPVGSALRTRALAGLALLDDVGLDPVHLASPEVVDRYLTKSPRKPPVKKLAMKVTADGGSRARSFTRWVEVAREDAVKDALTPCWEAYWKATRKTKLVVALSFKHSFRLDEYEDFDRSTLVIDDPAPSGDAAQSAADQCAKTVIEPISDDYARQGGSESRWTAKLTFELDT